MSDDSPAIPWQEFRLIERALYGAAGKTAFSQSTVNMLRRWAPATDLERALGQLPALVASMLGAGAEVARPLSAVWQLVRYAAKLLDDVQDGDAGDRVAAYTNMAVALIFASQAILQGMDHAEARHIICQRLAHAGLVSCDGQHKDLSADRVTPDEWLDIAKRKSGAIFGWAIAAGGAVAGLRGSQLDALHRSGVAMGVVAQIADDYNGVWFPHGASDLASGQPSLPVAYAYMVASEPERRQLDGHLQAARKGKRNREKAARAMVTRIGAVPFMLAAARVQEREFRASLELAECSLENAEVLAELVSGLFPLLRRID